MCYDLRMITALKNMLPQIDCWPSEDQEALLEAARSIEAERAGAYHASEAELGAIDRGLDDARAGRFASDDRREGSGEVSRRMIFRWTAAALADLESIHAYQKLHWPAMLAPFEARLAAIECRIVEFPLSLPPAPPAPEVEQRPGVRVVAFRDFPYRLFYRAEADAIDVLADPRSANEIAGYGPDGSARNGLWWRSMT